MPSRAVFPTLLLVSLLRSVAADPTGTALEPLASKHYTWPNIPYQVTGDGGGVRGPQSGYNQCNSTTEGPNAQCQTLIFNGADDFCMWSSNHQGHEDTISEGEAREVAWCTKSGHGSRLIPAGAITGVQYLYAKNYLQVVGYIDQTKVNLAADDFGGELDPHGADGQGNPLGGIAFTNSFSMNANSFAQALAANTTPSQSYTQVIEWVDFIGNGIFCLKMCNPSSPNAPHLCEHIYDEIGCAYNALADYAHINGTYTVCDSDDMTPVGVYTENGQTLTWYQSDGGSPPYTTQVPKSSNCHTYSSEQLFVTASANATTTSGGASATGGVSGSNSGSGSAATASNTSSKGAAVGLRAGGLFSGFLPVLVTLGMTLFTIFVSLVL